MSDPCKACGAQKCVAFEACQCCNKCRNCGQAHGPFVAPVLPPIVYPYVPPMPHYPPPVEPIRVTPWWEIERQQWSTTCALSGGDGHPAVEVAFNGTVQ